MLNYFRIGNAGGPGSWSCGPAAGWRSMDHGGPWIEAVAEAHRGAHRTTLRGTIPHCGGARRWSGSRRSSLCALVAGSMAG
jgi:hypothetical protein